jgi:arginine decarboxylase
MKFRFPIVIIDEDYRAENISGLGIRALAKAIEDPRVSRWWAPPATAT